MPMVLPSIGGQSSNVIAEQPLKVSAANSMTYSYALKWALELFAEALLSAPDDAPFRAALPV